MKENQKNGVVIKTFVNRFLGMIKQRWVYFYIGVFIRFRHSVLNGSGQIGGRVSKKKNIVAQG